MTVLRIAMFALAGGCALDLPQIDNPFSGEPSASFVVEPAEVGRGVSTLEVVDQQREVDFREVWDVGGVGDFVVLDWASNADRLTIDVDVLDGALGEQDLVLEFENEDELTLVSFEAL